ncbi:putative transposase [Vigna unguiculata]|uniref:Putative transposase n=1 Tax=Vigna unguiculata TaxID=3917 RepID=A0A4D6LE76_VIGUN|nr:putative transposase [Vigna unguiculata]
MSSGDPPRPPPVDKGKGPLSVPPSHIPSSSSSAPHTGLHTPSIDIGASPSPHTVPSPASIGGPSSAVGQQSAPSLVIGDIVAPQPMEEFQTRLSQVRSEVSSCADGTQEQSSVDPTQDENIRTRCWIEIVGGKKKGRLYGAGQLVSKYTGPNESLNQVPAFSSSNTKDLTNIRQQLSRSLEENEQLRSEFRSFQSLVLQYLPPDA